MYSKNWGKHDWIEISWLKTVLKCFHGNITKSKFKPAGMCMHLCQLNIEPSLIHESWLRTSIIDSNKDEQLKLNQPRGLWPFSHNALETHWHWMHLPLSARLTASPVTPLDRLYSCFYGKSFTSCCFHDDNAPPVGNTLIVLVWCFHGDLSLAYIPMSP